MDAFQKYWEHRSASCSGGTANFLHCQDMDGDEYLLTFREDHENANEYSVVGCSAVIVKFQAQAGDILVFASKPDGSVVVCTHRLTASAFQRNSANVEHGNVLQERSRNHVEPAGVCVCVWGCVGDTCFCTAVYILLSENGSQNHQTVQ